MNIQDKAVQFITKNPSCNCKEIMDSIGCGKSVAYSALATVSKLNEIKSTDSIVGVFSCLHQPATHPKALKFLQDTFAQFNVNRVVCLGDLIDHHFISRHVSEPDALNPNDEIDLAISNLNYWKTVFPDVLVCKGNHEWIPIRQAKTLGIPKKFIKSINDIYELPSTWKFADHFEIDNVWYEHGIGSNGMYGAKNTALKFGMSYVQGHTHAHGGIHHLSLKKKNIFGMNVGCLMDVTGYAGKYAKIYKNGISLGCGIVVNGKYGVFIPMEG